MAELPRQKSIPGAKRSAQRRHHYVPRFYLDRFTDQKGRLGAFDRQKGTSITTTANAVAVERDFYTFPEGMGLPANSLEEALSSQESDAAEAIRRLVAEGRVLRSHRESLILHMALQLLRTQRQRRSTKDLAQWTGTQLAQVQLSRQLSEGGIETDSERTFAESALRQLEDGELRVGLEKQALKALPLLALVEALSVLRSGWNWVLVILTAAKLITSDHPICLLGEPEPGTLASTVGIASALEIWFPLDPRHALVLSRDHSLGSPLLDLSNGHVRSINLRIALESERWSFFHPSSEGVKGFQIPPCPPRFREETLGKRDNGAGTTSELIRTSMERPRVPNERLLSGHRLKPFPR